MTEINEAARTFLRATHRAVLATHRAGGGIQAAPVTTALDDEDRVLVSTTSASAKARNLTRDPRAVLTVLNDHFFGAWAHVEGTTEVVRMPEALDLLVDYYRRARDGAEHPDWDDYRRAMVEQGRVVLRVTVDRVLLSG
jgi:PPOX class probable F420-dependent enzyme